MEAETICRRGIEGFAWQALLAELQRILLLHSFWFCLSGERCRVDLASFLGCGS
jgi:hypothetical protein